MNIFCNTKWRFYFMALFFILGTGLCYTARAQEFLTGVGKNPQIIKEAQQQKQHLFKGKSSEKQLFLPFFEDFSNYTGYPNADLFIDNQAFVNRTFPVFPPTMGVATLDALDENGKLYSHLNEVSKGADTLTSHYIRLDYLEADTPRIITLADSLYFSFYFQPGGAGIANGGVGGNIGNQPNKGDSLVLEFGYKDTANITVWNHIWSTPGFNVSEWTSDTLTPHQYFKQVLIPITDKEYLSDRFQFRFRNYASLEPQQGIVGWEGNVDQWHIDYIRLDTGRNYKDFYTNDLAFVSPTTSFLKNCQAMPYKQFHIDSLKTNFANQLTNLCEKGEERTSTYEYNIVYDGKVVSEYKTGAFNTPSYFDSGINKIKEQASPEIKKLSNFPTSLTDTATFKITHIFQNAAGVDKDFCVANDTCIFEQEFMDYYAYDDGTAEYGYCLNNQYNTAYLAMKFSLRVPDSLSAVRMWFNHTKNSENEAATFSIVVWKDNNGVPGDILYTTEGQKPQFDSLNYLNFHEYRFDKKIFISDANKTFWVGFKQYGNVQLNIGFDQNNDSRDFFKYNTDGNWTRSSFRGTPMLRPVFGKPLSSDPPQNPKTISIKIYPNPTTGELTITNYELRMRSVEIFDVYGRILSSHHLIVSSPHHKIDISHLNFGVYFVRITTENEVIVKKVIKN